MRRVALIAAALLTTSGLLAPSAPVVAAPSPPSEAPMSPVVQGVLAGDLVMVGNSNLLAAGGWRSEERAVADVDGDATELCVGRRYVPAACGENSSSATLDVPAGAHIVAARLYVDTTLSSVVSPVRVRLDGPAPGFDYTELATTTPGIPKLGEYAGSSGRGSRPLRQAVWDVTSYVQAAGAGTYTVADIMFERAGAFLPYASWALVAAYELDPAADLAAMPAVEQARFARRAISWYDGFVVTTDGSVDVAVTGLDVRLDQAPFGKTFHLVAHAQHRGADNLLFAGQPLGNNAPPGAAVPPAGVVLGADPACNTTTGILNDSICALGQPVVAKSPGPADYVAAVDGTTRSSGSGVDIDITRIPPRYFAPGTTSATLSLQSHGRAPVATGLLAASIDLPAAAPVVEGPP